MISRISRATKHGLFNPSAYLPGNWLLALATLVTLSWLCCSPIAPEEVLFFDRDVTEDTQELSPTDLMESDARNLRSIDGTWLVYSQIASCVSLLGNDEQVTRRFFIVQSQQEPNRTVNETWTACNIELSPVFGFQTIISEAILQTSYPVTSTDGLVTGSGTNRRYVSGIVAETWGLELDDPINDPYPQNREDPAIVDTDGDGNPGATLLIGDLCQAYHTQRTLTVYQGTFVAPDRIEGHILSVLQSMTVSATQPICGADYEHRPNEDRSIFTRIRIDGQGGSLNLDSDSDGVITCQEVLPYRDLLFERQEKDPSNCDFD